MKSSDSNISTDNPTFEVLLDGKILKDDHQVLSIAVVREINKIATARILIADGDSAIEQFLASETEDFKPGVKVDIKLGYKGENKLVFKGVIVNHTIRSKANDQSLLVIDCKDQAYQMTLTRKNNFFYEAKDSEIIQRIAQKYGLRSQLESTEVKHSEMVQFQVTDWEFCVNRAERNGRYLLTTNGSLHMAKYEIGSSSKKFKYSDIIAFETHMESRQQLSQIKAESWDSSLQKLRSFEAQPPAVKEQGNIDAATLSGLSKENDLILGHSGKIPAQELQSWANAKMEKNALSKIIGRIKCQGTLDVKVGDTIEIEKLSKRFNGQAFVSGICQNINEKNWETDIQFGVKHEWVGDQPRFISNNGLVPDIAGLHIGTVSQLEGDPEGEGRIRIKVPTIDSEKEGIWTRVSSLDAGKNRGSFFLPEIDDEVVLGFLGNDPRYPIMLGMLNSAKNPQPLDPKNENSEKGFVTRDGMKLLFNDKDKTVMIESPNGNQLSVSDKEGAIALKDENENSIILDKNGIILESGKDLILKCQGKLDIGGGDVSIAADKNFKCSGSTGAELSSDASAVIKGSLVEIN